MSNNENIPKAELRYFKDNWVVVLMAVMLVPQVITFLFFDDERYPNLITNIIEIFMLCGAIIGGIMISSDTYRMFIGEKNVGSFGMAILSIPLFALFIVLQFADAYFEFGIKCTVPDICSNISKFDYLYFSVSTFTTLGYGDFVPSSEPSRMAAAAEALTGNVFLGFALAVILVAITAKARKSNQ